MPADAASRKDAREALATVLTAALVGVGKPVEAVYAYPNDPIAESPVIQLASGGTARQASGINDTRWKNVFKIEVATFVRDAHTVVGWTEQDVEDTLDDVDKALADAIADARVNANWSYIGFSPDPNDIPDQSEIATDVERGYKIEYRNVYIFYVEG